MRQALLFTCLLAVTSSYSQTSEIHQFERKGFLFGFALGGGVLLSDEGGETEVYGRLAYPNWKIGWMVNPKLAVMLHAPGSSYFSETGERAFEGILPSMQYFFSEKAWILGGVGLAMDIRPLYKVDFSEAPDDFYFGYGTCLGIGVELWKKGKKFALDLSGRVYYGNLKLPDTNRHNTAFDLMLGFTWY